MRSLIRLECKKTTISEVIHYIDILRLPNSYTEPTHIFLLNAEVGGGKTYLVNEYVKTKGITESSSPSFAFIHEYEKKIFHYDLYLKNDIHAKTKLLESLILDGIHFVEWGDFFLLEKLQNLGFFVVLIQITNTQDNNARIYDFFV
ncbi:tRNA (adenosine(37)-N6)-threonylcarbamoyltransferase complex ATPase subunit type 1 TsaE [Helicobacter didelphidarum]|uniref:tRNA (Adenosine(37)-N6)-threonylcarbamoyltransferase complex ATPase subunit type 1 TsaE n=1 Tax=Helicobacter didelphidarum TaxID=2040648 RepID=A0A3D8IG87_9HELI|nr:tRNA (adenosine(37)-N6)-threonylcarbamoyltransferase complex ATPase subunit type 1 TsaE [Helicobacter didelphidarum]RDU63581.1 tRNA (adenosine(37)-N6)-threonylcarbamoyltransferase complex ATPase subunit type 1 TsaE [Helicobacter didelphidarum]